jgi:hypothetical protein
LGLQRGVCMLSKFGATKGCMHAVEAWGYNEQVKDLKTHDVGAFVSDGSQLQFRAALEDSCSLRILPDDLGGFDMAFAFRANFTRDYPGEDLCKVAGME